MKGSIIYSLIYEKQYRNIMHNSHTDLDMIPWGRDKFIFYDTRILRIIAINTINHISPRSH